MYYFSDDNVIPFTMQLPDMSVIAWQNTTIVASLRAYYGTSNLLIDERENYGPGEVIIIINHAT